MKDSELQTLWCRGMSVLPRSTIMGVLPLLLLILHRSSHLGAVKTLFCFITGNIHQSCTVNFLDQRIIAKRNFRNLFIKLKEWLEIIKDGQQLRNWTEMTATRRLEQWKSPSGKKHGHPESDLYPEPPMFYWGQDTVVNRKISLQVSSDKNKILLNSQEKTTTDKFSTVIMWIYD